MADAQATQTETKEQQQQKTNRSVTKRPLEETVLNNATTSTDAKAGQSSKTDDKTNANAATSKSTLDNGPNATPSGSKRNSQENKRVIDSITTWIPNTANLTHSKQPQDQNNENQSPPQSVAIIAGRKYIMVPKTNVMSISPSGLDNVNGVHNLNESHDL